MLYNKGKFISTFSKIKSKSVGNLVEYRKTYVVLPRSDVFE